jgi:hypothetical protein
VSGATDPVGQRDACAPRRGGRVRPGRPGGHARPGGRGPAATHPANHHIHRPRGFGGAGPTSTHLYEHDHHGRRAWSGEPAAQPWPAAAVAAAAQHPQPGRAGDQPTADRLLSSALNPTLDLLGHTLLATPDVTTPGSRIRELWWASAGIANSGFVLLVLLGGVLVMTHESLQARYSAKEILPRLAVAFTAANTSLLLAGWAIRLANAVSRAVLGTGVDPQRVAQTLSPLRLLPGPGPRNLFLILLGLVVASLALGLLVTCVLRAALVALLVAGAPLALALHALPHTDGLARLWWRALGAALGVQVGQALVLVVALRVFFDADRAQVLGIGTGRLADLLVSGGLFWLLLRIPGWARRAVFGARSGGLGRLVRGYGLYLLVGRFLRRVPRR